MNITTSVPIVVVNNQISTYFLLTSPGWPSPSLQQCLDATTGSTIFSSIDFISGYHQIPCTQQAKQALAFSPGFGFPQLTWSRMPQGVKPASQVFQKTMSHTFKDHEDCILPPFFFYISALPRQLVYCCM